MELEPSMLGCYCEDTAEKKTVHEENSDEEDAEGEKEGEDDEDDEEESKESD